MIGFTTKHCNYVECYENRMLGSLRFDHLQESNISTSIGLTTKHG